MAIILYLEEHRSPSTLNFIKKYVGHPKIVFCHEHAPRLAKDTSQLKNLKPSLAELKRYATPGDDYYQEYFQILCQHQTRSDNGHYLVDTAFQTANAIQTIVDYIDETDVACNDKGQYAYKMRLIMFIRNKTMAENILRIQKQHPDQDIVLIVGLAHATVLYHLLYQDAKSVFFINGVMPSLLHLNYRFSPNFDVYQLPYPGCQDDSRLDIIQHATCLPNFTHDHTAITDFKKRYAAMNQALETFHMQLTELALPLAKLDETKARTYIDRNKIKFDKCFNNVVEATYQPEMQIFIPENGFKIAPLFNFSQKCQAVIRPVGTLAVVFYLGIYGAAWYCQW
tara:strand:- start:16187 stop:17203 length:1017 start_codon:yes stop_codon:yes gene_type:complete